MTPAQVIAQFDTNNDSMISWDEFWYAWNLEDDHDDHDHIEPEKVLANPAGCPADTVINVFHLEKGEYVVEFETEDEDVNEFHLAALPMLGGHAHHHHHGHGSGPFEWAGIFSMNDNTHVWSMQQVDGAYADQTMRLVLIPTDTPTEATMHGLESSVKDLMEGDCPVVEDGETMTPIVASGSCFELHVGTGPDSTFTMDTAGITGLAIYAQHVPIEFERTQHYLKDSTGEDIEPIAEEGADGHAHAHGDEGEHNDGHEEHGVCHDMSDHSNHDEYTNKADCEAAGYMWIEGEENHEGDVCHDETTHQNTEHDNQADCEAAGHTWMESDEDGHGHDGEDGEGDHDDHGHGDHDDHDDHDEHHGKLGFLTIHIEAEGDYGFALPSNIEMFILSSGGSHEGHDHGSHGDSHGGHGDSHGDSSAEMVCYDMSTHTVLTSYHDKDECETAGYMWVSADSGPGGDNGGDGQADSESEIVAGEGEDDFEYDPHSWLDPLSFKAQVNTVLAALIETFPEGEETFTTNADSFKTSLDKLHLDIIEGTGDSAGCTTDTVAANHNAYSYISVRYGIDFVTVHGLDPEGEPSAADILEVIERIEEDNIQVLYIEEYSSRSVVDAIVDQTDVTVEILYTMELPPSDSTDNYISLMYKNLENLKSGLGCTA